MQQILIKYDDETMLPLESYSNQEWIDLRSAVDIKMGSGDYQEIPLGVKIIPPDNSYEVHITTRRRTFEKWGIIPTTGVYVVSDPEKPIMIPVIAMRDTHIYKGDRIAHFRLVKKQENYTIDRI